MPFELIFLLAVFAVAIISFALLKRPMYESMLAAFIVLVILTAVLGAWEFSWTGLWGFIWKAMKDSSLYVIIVFIVSAHLLLQKSPRLPHVHGEIAPPCRTTAPLHKITENL